MSGLHVYCVVPEDAAAPEALEGLEDAPVMRRVAAGLGAWASALDEPPPPDAELLRRHHDIVLVAFRAGGVLPVRFGQWLPDESALVDWLERDADHVREGLERLRDAVEFGVRFGAQADAHEHAPSSAAVPDVPGISRRAEVAEARSYLRTIARRRALRREALIRREDIVGRLSSAVAPLVRDRRVLPRAPGDLAAVAHLVDRARVEPYREAVIRFLEREAPSGAEVTGPWPPWSFVT